MEWDAMHRPLQPPPGYEHYHTAEAVFPGRRLKLKKMKTWGEVVQSFRNAWRLYRHSYIPDPEMAKWEREHGLVDDGRSARRILKTLKRSEKVANKSFEKAEQIFEKVREEVKSRRPEAEELVKDRASVLRKALQEFAAGYSEVVNGARNVWGQPPYDEVLVREDNHPVVYKAKGGPE